MSLGAGDCDVGEVRFLDEHPWEGGKAGGHEGVATEEEDSGPLESFGFVDRGEGEDWRGGVRRREESGEVVEEGGEGG